MISIEFTPEEMEILDYERYHHPHPKVQQRMQALYLKSKGLSHQDIMIVSKISSRTTLSTWFKLYQVGNIEALRNLRYQGQKSELNGHVVSIKSYFEQNPPHSINEAVDAIEKLTGIERSPSQVREFLKKTGFKRLKVGTAPGKELNEKKIAQQKAFHDDELKPRLEEAKQCKRLVFFVDASHFVHGHFLAVLWCLKRLFIPSASGRKRFNVLGALNAITKEVITLCNNTSINTESILGLLDKVKATSRKDVAITLVMDNARYQRNSRVMAYAESLGVELLFLPSYSPNLNLIERLWKFVKKECLYGKYYATFDEFTTAIETCLSETATTHKNKLLTLLSLKFQLFENVQFLPV